MYTVKNNFIPGMLVTRPLIAVAVDRSFVLPLFRKNFPQGIRTRACFHITARFQGNPNLGKIAMAPFKREYILKTPPLFVLFLFLSSSLPPPGN